MKRFKKPRAVWLGRCPAPLDYYDSGPHRNKWDPLAGFSLTDHIMSFCADEFERIRRRPKGSKDHREWEVVEQVQGEGCSE